MQKIPFFFNNLENVNALNAMGQHKDKQTLWIPSLILAGTI